MSERLYREMLLELGASLDKKILDDPDFSAKIPPTSHLVIQVAVPSTVDARMRDDVAAFNKWMREVAERNMEEGETTYVATCHLRPLLAQAAESLTPCMVASSCGEYELQPA
jgi:hypothetical protein